ncbi:MAG: hydroxymethylpyrimidine ABC transporter ATPase component [Osedax symbiont Rs2]|nr:MAG: hydroxymethylpyrimidine ABC transporter ATPase component [Osedax symbiont Rs2]
MSISVQLSAASLQYAGAAQATFAGLNLNLPAAKWTCLLGPSGCGKTSLLRLLAGLIDSSHQLSGQISCSDGLSIDNRISYMAQQDLLLPWLNVLDNVCLKAKLLTGKVSAGEQHKARQLLAQLNLSGIEKSLPDQLSGGMRQRVALARTLMQDTPIVLMDEPFSALDAVNRYKLQDLAAKVLQGRTVLLITHDPQEALRLSDQLYLFSADQQLLPLPLPDSLPPRAVDAQLGQYQQSLLQKMQVLHG